MKNLLITFFIFFSAQAFAVQTVICTPAQNPNVKVTVVFYKDINPAKPFIGSYNWGATLKISRPRLSDYVNETLRMTPEVYYSDISLRGDAEGIYLRLYPHFDTADNFINYTGQLFINDLDSKVYYNFVDRDGAHGLICK